VSSFEKEILEDVFVVDADVHVHESPKALLPYCEAPWQKSLEALQDVPERYLDIPGFSPGGLGLSAPFPGRHDAHRKVHDPEQMRRDLSSIGVDIGILFPDHLLKLAILPQAEYAAALARAYNAWLVDRWVAPPQGLLGCVVAAPQSPHAAAEEIRRYARHPGIVGIYLPTAGVEPLWGHRRYDPIYEAAQEARLPVLLHSVNITHPVYPHQVHGFETEMARHTVSHVFSMIVNLVSIITTGVQVRYPDLKIGFTEAGLAWVPFIAERLDKEYLERRREVPFLDERPSRYIKRCYFATQPIEEPEDPAHVETYIRLFDGATTTMFASDWPHHDFDHPRKVIQYLRDPQLRAQVMGENALAFFGIDRGGNRLDVAGERSAAAP
jgi:uncharacterized protein